MRPRLLGIVGVTWHGVLTLLGQPRDFWVLDRGGPRVNLEEHDFDEPWTMSESPSDKCGLWV